MHYHYVHKGKYMKKIFTVGTTHVHGFLDFIREQGVIGLSIGFVLGTAVTKVVASLVSDIVNPILSILLGSTENLKEMKLNVGNVSILWGSFLAAIVDFIVIACVVYLVIRILKIDALDKKKN
ncbi:MAG TPA: mechanosensitive ion channel protein MscL [Candidatus Pacebacteria bacterium]|nr:mechanosensitive ion channel protein MscL [Candidatus Paceibacterota bacterium]HAX01909.1 mechanosensitive ion channel protein MscL [Candidatus Paceibacterota bacterium]